MKNIYQNFKSIEKANKSFVWINGRKFFDLSLHSGVLLLGHNSQTFLNTLSKIKNEKLSLSSFGKKKITDKILSIIKKYFKSTKNIIFCTTGSESVIKAIRICRALNPNKNKIAMVSGSWHGSVDQTLFFSKKNLIPIPLSSGLNDSSKKDLIILPYNDIEQSKKILDKKSKDISCIIVEPITASLPLEKSKYYLKFLRKFCTKKKIILIFDEMITGIRTDKGSVQNKFNILPDITLVGKAIGGGLPISLILVNKKINNKISKLKKKIFFGGTYSANNYSFYSCLNTLNYIDKNKNLVKNVIDKTKLLQEKLNTFSKKNNLDVKVYRFESFLRIIFSKISITNRLSRDFLERKNNKKISHFVKFLYSKKILYPRNGIIFMSTATTGKDLEFLTKYISIGLKKYFK